MTAKKVTVGIVGAGAIAQSYVQAIENAECATLSGVADSNDDAAAAVAEKTGCTAYASHKELLDAGVCDAVVVSTPPATHPEICMDFLKSGVHVLCEKPMAISSEDALEMLATADKHESLLTMGSKFRYVNDVIKAKSIVDSGILGDIVLFENAFTGWVNMTERWNSQPAISGGGVLIDNGTHSVDIMRYFLGPIDEVQAVEGKRLQSEMVEDTVRIFAHSLDGVMGSVDLSWSLNKELDTYIEIYGSAGTIKVGWRGSRYRQSSSAEWIEFGTGYDKVQAFTSQIENFCKAIRNEEMLVITAEDALASVRVVEAAYQSMRKNAWVSVGRESAANVSVVNGQ